MVFLQIEYKRRSRAGEQCQQHGRNNSTDLSNRGNAVGSGTSLPPVTHSHFVPQADVGGEAWGGWTEYCASNNPYNNAGSFPMNNTGQMSLPKMVPSVGFSAHADSANIQPGYGNETGGSASYTDVGSSIDGLDYVMYAGWSGGIEPVSGDMSSDNPAYNAGTVPDSFQRVMITYIMYHYGD